MTVRLRGVPWTNLTNVVETGDKLVKHLGADATWDAGADTRGTLVIPGGRDGYVEFFADGRGYNAMMGLSYQGTSAGYADIDFAIACILDHFQVYEAGAGVYDAGAASLPLNEGWCRVERSGSNILYKLNGTTLRTLALTPAQVAADLYADCSFYNAGDNLVAWRMSIDELDDAAPIAVVLGGLGTHKTALSVAFPSGTRRYANGPLASNTDGFYEARLRSVSPITRAINERSYSLQTVEIEAEIADEDGSLARLIATDRPYWSAVTLKQASPDVSYANWLTEFTGRLEGWSQDGPAFKLKVRSDDVALRSTVPDGTLSSADFPAITPDAIGSPERLIYGRHRSQGIAGNATGAIKALCVQPWNGSTALFYLGNGILPPTQVFKAGVAMTAGGWSLQASVVNGRALSWVALTADPGSDEITFDCDGLDWRTDGTGWADVGGPEHAVDVLKHWLANWVFGRWKSGAWLAPDPTKIDLASFADVKLALGRVAAGRAIVEARAAIDAINEWGQSFGVYPVLTREGRIGLVLDDPNLTAADMYGAPLVLAQDSGDIQADWPGEGVAKRVVTSFSYLQAQGKYLGTHEVQDPDVAVDAVATIEAPWSPAMIITPPAAVTLNDAAADPQLTFWVRAKSLLEDYNSGDSIGTINDQSGHGHNFTQASVGKQPKFRFFPTDERAWIEFDGADDQLDAATPTATLTNYKLAGGWTMLLAFRIRSAFASARVMFGTSAGGVIVGTTTGPNRAYVVNDDGAADAIASGALRPDTWYVACARHAGGNLYFGINDARKLSMLTLGSGNTAALTGNVSLGGIGGSYSAFDLAELILFKDDCGENTLRLMDYMLSEHVHRYKSSLYGMKDVASRHLRTYRKPRMTIRLSPAPPSFAGLELGRIVRVQSPLGSSPSPGWDLTGSGSRPGRIASRTYDSTANALALGLTDVHEQAVGIWDTGKALRAIDAGRSDWARQEGVAILGRSSFTRRSDTYAIWTGTAWVETPSTVLPGTAAAIEAIAAHTPKRGRLGLLIERQHRNYLLRSSNRLGVGSIAPGDLNGTGVNGSAIADDATDIVGGPLTTPMPKSFKFTAGNPHTSDLYVTMPDTILTEHDEPLWFTALMKNDTSNTSADRLAVRIKRLDDNKYWNDATPAWQAGSAWNALSNTAGYIDRAWLGKILAHSANSQFRVDVGLPSGGTASRVAHLYLARLDKNLVSCYGDVLNDDADYGFPGPEYVQSSSDEVRYDCPNGAQLSSLRGTILMRAVLGFNFNEVALDPVYFFRLLSGGGTFAARQSGVNLQFQYGAATAQITFAGLGATRLSEWRMAFRWTSSAAELGYNQRADVFWSQDGASWYQGNAAITTFADLSGQIFFICGQQQDRSSMWVRHEVRPICLPDEEIKSLLA